MSCTATGTSSNAMKESGRCTTHPPVRDSMKFSSTADTAAGVHKHAPWVVLCLECASLHYLTPGGCASRNTAAGNCSSCIVGGHSDEASGCQWLVQPSSTHETSQNKQWTVCDYMSLQLFSSLFFVVAMSN